MVSHAAEHNEPSEAVFRRVNLTLVILAILTFVLGIVGFLIQGPTGDGHGCPGQAPPWFADWLYRTIALFEFAEANLQIPGCYDHVVLAIARFTGPAATILFIARILLGLLRDPFDRLRLSRFANHTVVIGFGNQGQVRALEAAASGADVAALEKVPSEALHAVARRHGVVLASGDARNVGARLRTRIDRARNIVITTGNDAQNLLIAQAVAARLPRVPTAQPKIEVSISDPLVRRALDANAADGLIDVFSVEDMSAYLLCEEARFFEIADLLGQRRLHVVMLGFGRIGASLLAQILRSSATADLDTGTVSILTPGTSAARELLRLSYPGAEDVAHITYVAVDPMHATLDDGVLMGKIEAAAPVTAVVALGTRSADTLPLVLAIREATRRTGHWAVPLFFGIEHSASLAELSCPIGAAKHFSDVLHPFEFSAHLCTRKASEERDRVAEAIHEAYLQVSEQMRKEGVKPSMADEALVAWQRLRPTFRQANRRAADHVAAKLVSVGCVVPSGPPIVPLHFHLLQDNGSLERLAALEHRSWAIDRQLEGWQVGEVRDNARRIHDCLKPYADLSEPTKELDRSQIRELGMVLRRRASTSPTDGKVPLVRFDLWVALIGSRSLNRADSEWLCKTLTERILPRLLELHPEHAITVLSPLAPGVDLIGTKAVLRYLAQRGRQHRLLAVEAVLAKQLVDDFESSWRAGGVGDLDLPGEGRLWTEARAALIASIESLARDPTCERILELDPVGPGATPEERQFGYRRQNAYLVQRAHVVIAAVGAPPMALPGGCGEAIAWRRDRASIPNEMPQYLARPNLAEPGCPSLILIDVSAREVSEEPARVQSSRLEQPPSLS